MSYDILNRQTQEVVELTQQDISLLFAAGLQKLWRLSSSIIDASPDSIHRAELFNELRDATIKLSKLREVSYAR